MPSPERHEHARDDAGWHWLTWLLTLTAVFAVVASTTMWMRHSSIRGNTVPGAFDLAGDDASLRRSLYDDEITHGLLALPVAALLPDGATPLTMPPEDLPQWPDATMTLGYETTGDGMTRQKAVLMIRDGEPEQLAAFYEAALTERGYHRVEPTGIRADEMTFTRDDRYIMIRIESADGRLRVAADVLFPADVTEHGPYPEEPDQR